LRKTLKDEDPWMRHFAAVTLGALGEAAKDAVPDLVKAFDDEEYVVQKSAVEAVGAIGPEAKQAVPALLHAWKDPREHDKTRNAARSDTARRRLCASACHSATASTFSRPRTRT